MDKRELLKVAKPIALTAKDVKSVDRGKCHGVEIPILVKHNGKLLGSDICDPYVVFEELSGVIAKNGRVYPLDVTRPKSRELLYKKGDILYVREVWSYIRYKDINGYVYKVSEQGQRAAHICAKQNKHLKWNSSCTMPKEAARLFLRITNTAFKKRKVLDPDTQEEVVVWAKTYEFETIFPNNVKISEPN